MFSVNTQVWWKNGELRLQNSQELNISADCVLCVCGYFFLVQANLGHPANVIACNIQDSGTMFFLLYNDEIGVQCHVSSGGKDKCV